jgi:multidrug resistance efflux pump
VASRLRPRIIVPIVFVLGLSAAGIYALTTRLGDNGILTASGTVEAEEIRIAPEIAGRVSAVLVEAGEAVAAGDRLVLMDDSLLQAQRERVVAGVATAEQALAAAELNLQAAGLQKEMVSAAARAQDALRQRQAWQLEAEAGIDLPAWYLTQDEMLDAARAEIDSAQAAVDEARRRLEALLEDPAHGEVQRAELRLRQAQAAFLAADGVFQRALAAREPQDLYDRAEEEWTLADDERDTAQESFDDLLDDDRYDDLWQARADLAVADARLSAAQAYRDSLRIGQRSLEVEQAEVRLRQAETAAAQSRAALQQAQAELRAVDVQLERMVLRAPVAGTILGRSTDPGEVLPAGALALTLGLLDDLTITVYLPEDRYGQVRLGDPVRVTVDSFPGDVFEGRVLRIADQAEFTPRNVQTEEGRRTTVFAVNIAIDNPAGRLKPGMPADVEFAGAP